LDDACRHVRSVCFRAVAMTGLRAHSLHAALPIWPGDGEDRAVTVAEQVQPLSTLQTDRVVDLQHPFLPGVAGIHRVVLEADKGRSEEHTSELQSREKIVCRLLLEKKKKTIYN